MEIKDFSAALRAMARNVDVLAERHDVAQMAQLRQEAADHVVQTRRHQDLIEELRRQVAAMERSLDGIGRMRRTVEADPLAAVPVLVEALMVIYGECENYTGSASCRVHSGRTRRADCAVEAWCEQCVARDALERAGALRPAGLEVKP